MCETEHPCQDHPCDNCRICQSGRCCRRDDPGYILPKLGQWAGPIHGELGVLHDDGTLAQCHCCGGYYSILANHVWKSHNLLPQEYRAIFGLNRTTALAGPHFRARMRATACLDGLARITPEEQMERYTSEQRSQASAGKPRRLEFARRLSERKAEPRRCACGCGQEFTGAPQRRYATKACRWRAARVA